MYRWNQDEKEMKPMQKKLVGLIVACGAIATSAMVLGKAVEIAPIPLEDQVVSTPNGVQGGTAIAIAENDVFVVDNGMVVQLDRNSLAIKKRTRLNSQVSSTVAPAPALSPVQSIVD
ncbi:MAG: hypothetical protein ACKVQS_05045 [Fimbriimonadaceae bacterium]